MEIISLNGKENSIEIAQLLNEHQEKERGKNAQVEEKISLGAYVKGVYVGGITGKITGNRLHISLLAIKKEYRGEGYGEGLVKEVEKMALAKNCRHLTVNTQEYQGLAFYQKLNFSIYGQIADCPFEGTTKYFLRKSLKTK